MKKKKEKKKATYSKPNYETPSLPLHTSKHTDF